MIGQPPRARKRWDHRGDCFVMGVLIGVLSTSAFLRSGIADGGLYAAFVATVALPPLGLRLQTLDHGSGHGAGLHIAWQCVLGAVAVIAGLSVGVTLAPSIR